MLLRPDMTTRLEDAPEGTALERAEEASLPTIRPELAEDIDVIAELHRSAFSGTAESELVDAIRRSAHFIGDLSLVAELNGQLVGHLLMSRVELVPDGGGTPIPLLALAPVAVSPMHQGRGIGTLLMRAGVALASNRAEEAAVVVLGSPEFYGRFGFTSAADAGIDGPWPAPDGVFQVLPLPTAEAPRPLPPGTVAYPAAFSGI